MQAPQIIAFYNGQTIPLENLLIPVDDRAYQFGDAIYEVLRVYKKKPLLLSEHMKRLATNLDAIGIVGVKDIAENILHNIAANQTSEGMVYVQISRGTAARNHSFYDLDLKPNILIYTKAFSEHPSLKDATSGILAITHDDIRWGRCDIKSVNLLANCLAQTKAHQMGAKEAILIRDNNLTEGSSSNVFVVKSGILASPPLSKFILPGTRRNFLIKELTKRGHEVQERPIPKHELYDSDEIFITSTMREAVAVVTLDDFVIGDGCVGAMAKLSRSLIIDAVE